MAIATSSDEPCGIEAQSIGMPRKIASVNWNVMNKMQPPSSGEGRDSGGSCESTLPVEAHGRQNGVLKSVQVLTSSGWMLVA